MVTMRGAELPVLGHQPVVGEIAPDFVAVKADLSEISLGELKGRRVVLNIFPSIDTGVCAQSVRAFNEHAAALDNTVVLCVSKDLPFAQARFCGAEGIDKVMTVSMFRNADFDLDYGVRIDTGALRGLLARAVVVIDAEGKIIYNELVPEIGQEPDYEAVISALS
ncbi:thiol peroxidase [Porphyromonas sp.]|uniref:thiol peroxidase n=1 Tax=Porphyromonas sp. TaxID=1924944 RepID=UPI0026DBBBDF|nr:thiol peroxidase [Porphyromonas sp.]MDO4770814.1 thiol peroxidase [Porphyromonas sp.]